MALPPRGDPRRPLYLAASSCRVLGVLALLATTCMGVPFVRLLGRGGGGLFPPLALLLMLGLYGGVGAAYLVFAHYVRRRQLWAVVAALCLTGILALLTALGVVGGIVGAIGAGSSGGPPLLLLTLVGLPVLILVALGQLIYHLAKSIAAIRNGLPDEARGFDVLPVTVVPAGGQPTVSDRGPK